MLILGRRIGESILIGDDIKITIFQGLNGSVKVGIEAPKETLILREEVAKKGDHTSKAKGLKDTRKAKEASGTRDALDGTERKLGEALS